MGLGECLLEAPIGAKVDTGFDGVVSAVTIANGRFLARVSHKGIFCIRTEIPTFKNSNRVRGHIDHLSQRRIVYILPPAAPIPNEQWNTNRFVVIAFFILIRS